MVSWVAFPSPALLTSLLHNREKQVGDDDAGKQLANAPSTILSGDALPDIEGLDLTFKPSMGEMSQLALPENLPLDFIASKPGPVGSHP